MKTFRKSALLVAVVAVAGLTTAAQVGAAEQASTERTASLGTNGAAVPELAWGPCPEGSPPGYQCAEAEVPLSYRNPDGEKITLALGRLPAKDPARKLGTVFYNPGGPGGSGQFPPELTPRLRERFDIVGFDPRGIGASTPLRCFETGEQRELLASPFPINREQTERKFADTAKATRICGENAGELINHMSTANVARDLDLLRQAVGDDKLSYYGISYGTHLGSVYVNLFPDRVRAVVLDAVLDPVEWTTGYAPGSGWQPFSYRLGSFEGTQRSLESFLAACAGSENCAFREPGRDLREKYAAILDHLRREPVTITPPGGEPLRMTYQDVVELTRGALYSAENSVLLAEYLQALAVATGEVVSERAAPVAALPPRAQRPGYQGDDYQGPEQSLAVMCADTDNPPLQHVWPHYARRADRHAPGFGSSWTYLSLPCATWPGRDRDRYAGPWDRQTANPVLLIGNREGDPATPYEDAVRTSKLLGDARLLTLDTFGHGALGHSECIDGAVDRYFIGGALPDEGTVCEPARQPFDP